jgi:hypothetical protein
LAIREAHLGQNARHRRRSSGQPPSAGPEGSAEQIPAEAAADASVMSEENESSAIIFDHQNTRVRKPAGESEQIP